jgi:hypothetical protein
MSRWDYIDERWDPDRDPALRRMHDALAQTAQDGPGPDETPGQLPDATRPEIAAATPSRRDRIAALVGRIRSGDLSAVDALRKLLE